MTHLLKLSNKMCEYEMDPANFVEDTEWTRFRLQMDRQTERRTEGQVDRQSETSIPNFVGRGVKMVKSEDFQSHNMTFLMLSSKK